LNNTGYFGPCAPARNRAPHHYTLELYALDSKLDLAPSASRAQVEQAMDGHIVGKAVYLGAFQR
jgi:phosphatidylethanolamine-binding protein (PEBP) family uncharacterized protein